MVSLKVPKFGNTVSVKTPINSPGNENSGETTTKVNGTHDSNGASEIITGNSARQRELEELLLKLDLMEQECVQEKLNEEREALKDDFVAIRRQLYKSLMETRELIRARHTVRTQQGNSIEVIQKGAQIESKLREVDSQFSSLKETFKRQLKQRGKRYSEQLLDQRFQEMQLMKQQIEESRKLFKNAASMSTAEIQSLTEFKATRNPNAGGVGPSQQDWRDLNDEEKAILDRWGQKDEDIDRQVLEIGDAIDRLGEVALQIGQKADRQAELVAGLHQQADDANEELLAVNNAIKSILHSQGGFNFICKLVLTLILIGLVGFILSGIQKRISLG